MRWLLSPRKGIRRTRQATFLSVVVSILIIGVFFGRITALNFVQRALAVPIEVIDALTPDSESIVSDQSSEEANQETTDDTDSLEGESIDKKDSGATDDSDEAKDEAKDKTKDKGKNKQKNAKDEKDTREHGQENEEPSLEKDKEQTEEEKEKEKEKDEGVIVPKANSREEQLDQKLERIRNPRNNEEAFEYIAVDAKRKLREAAREAEREGKTLDLFSNRRFSADMEESYARLEKTIKTGILNGSIDEREGLQTLAQARVAGRKFTAGGDFLNGRVPDRWNPGRPDVVNGLGPTTPGFQLAQAQSRMAKFYDNMNTLLTSPRPTPTLGRGMTRHDVVRQQSLNALDHTAITQGNMGTCWVCSAAGCGWAWAPDQMSSANNQLIFNQRFVSPFNGRSKSYSVSQLMPTSSNLAFDMNRAGMGEQSYVNMLDQVLIGNLAGNSAPWNGGFPEAASNTLYTVTGINGVPTQSSVGGTRGLIDYINKGTVRIVQYIPFNGHSASNSGIMLPTTDGGYLGFGINDNSWGPQNEHAFLATYENVGKFQFPGGGGSQFGGLGDGITGAVSGVMAGLLGSMQGQPVSAADQQAAKNATKKRQDEEYNKLDPHSRVLVRSVCVASVTPSTTSLPQICKRALTDPSLPSLVSGRGAALRDSNPDGRNSF